MTANGAPGGFAPMRRTPSPADHGAMKSRLVLLAIVSVAVLGACGSNTDKKSGTVAPVQGSSSTTVAPPTAAAKPDPAPVVPEASSSTTATTARATTTTQKATTTTTARVTTTTEEPTTTTTAATSVSYANCSAAKAAGAAPLHRGDPGYSSKLDRDGDGVACES